MAESIESVPTPALLLHRDRLTRNIARMRAAVAGSGSALRPHLKTAKCIEVARLLFDGGTGPITVSTLREAEVFAEAGFRDITYAVGFEPAKLDRVVALRRSGVALSLLTDDVAVAQVIAARAMREQLPLPTWIEIDVDGHRAGLAWDDAASVLAVATALGRDYLAGVLTHAGGAYEARSRHALQTAAEHEVTRARTAGEALAATIGSAVPVSIGSTPTALSPVDRAGIDEVRAGVFAFFDLVMAGIGVCALDEIALSVLTTVIGVYPERGQVIVDAGWMALSRDRGTARQAVDQGYGVICDMSGTPITGAIVAEANQEHGIVRAPGNDAALAGLRAGDRLRILPNHACATAAQHDRYRIVSGSSPLIVETWERFSGW